MPAPSTPAPWPPTVELWMDALSRAFANGTALADAWIVEVHWPQVLTVIEVLCAHRGWPCQGVKIQASTHPMPTPVPKPDTYGFSERLALEMDGVLLTLEDNPKPGVDVGPWAWGSVAEMVASMDRYAREHHGKALPHHQAVILPPLRQRPGVWAFNGVPGLVGSQIAIGEALDTALDACLAERRAATLEEALSPARAPSSGPRL